MIPEVVTMSEPNDKQEAALDETIDESFPASDPPANTVETGMAGSAREESIRDNKAEGKFEMDVNGETAFVIYERTPTSIVFLHTEVPTSLRGHHVGETLVKGALAAARQEKLRISATCKFVRAYLSQHPEEGN
jgi:predicted GNAT family acetyltransferase